MNDNQVSWPVRNEYDLRLIVGQESCEDIADIAITGITDVGEIILGSGMYNLVFGIPVDCVKHILGEPNKIITEELDDVNVFEYYKELLRVKIDVSSTPILYSIETHNPTTKIFEELIFGASMNHVRELLAVRGYDDIKYTDNDYFETLWCPQIQTTFSFDYNKLIEIEFSPFRNQEGDWLLPPFEYPS